MSIPCQLWQGLTFCRSLSITKEHPNMKKPQYFKVGKRKKYSEENYRWNEGKNHYLGNLPGFCQNIIFEFFFGNTISFNFPSFLIFPFFWLSLFRQICEDGSRTFFAMSNNCNNARKVSVTISQDIYESFITRYSKMKRFQWFTFVKRKKEQKTGKR